MANIISVAKMILLGLLPVEVVANSFQLANEKRQQFINETEQRIRECLLDNGETMDAHTGPLIHQLEALQQNPASQRKDSTLEIKGSGGFVGHNDQPDEIEVPIAPSVKLAFSLITTLKDPQKRLNPDAWLSFSTGALSGGHSVLKNTALVGLSAAGGVAVAAGFNIGIGLIREYQYQRKKEQIKVEFDKTMTGAEQAYLTLHQMYDVVATHYQKSLETIKNEHGTKSDEYKNSMEEWRLAERYFNEQIHQQQQSIATISALSQQEQSKRRLDRVSDGISTALSMANFSGPPGMIASALIKGVTTLGAMVGYGMIQDSARFNHGITSASKVLLITDKDSLEKATEQLSHSVNPAVALSGPVLGSRSIAGFNVDRAVYTDASLAEKLVADVGGRRSCSFALSKPIPEIPVVGSVEPGQNYMNNPELKKKGKEQLKTLIEAQKSLISEQDFLYAMGSKMMQKHKPWPHVINFAELSQSLSDAHQAIKKEKEQIRQQMGYDYSSNRNAEGMVMLAELDRLERAYEGNLKHLQRVGQELENTPHRAYYTAERQEIIDTYAADPKAREMLWTDIEFNIKALEQLIDHCEKLGKGRHISNMGEAINELETQLLILEQARKIAQERSFDNEMRFSECKEKVDIIANKSAYLDKLRLEYVATSFAGEHSLSEQYEELSDLQESLGGYGENLPTIHLDLPSESKEEARTEGLSIFQQIDRLQQSLLPALEQDLQDATPIDRSKLSKTDAIVSPNRVFFGFTKHGDMQREVNEKVAQLSGSFIIDTIQVMPLRKIDEEVIASCQGRYDQLTKVIEGLKTEIQWLDKFQDACASEGITIANIEKLSAYYERQIQTLEKACQHRDQVLGQTQQSTSTLSKSSFTEMKAKLQNVIHEHDPEEELGKAKEALARVTSYSSEGLLNTPESKATSLDDDLLFSETHPDI